MKFCGLHCLLLQALRTGGYSNKGFLLIQASDALIKLDHRMQNPWVLCSHPRPGRLGQHQSGSHAAWSPRPQARDALLHSRVLLLLLPTPPPLLNILPLPHSCLYLLK